MPLNCMAFLLRCCRSTLADAYHRAMQRPSQVDAYLAALPSDQRELLEGVRARIAAARAGRGRDDQLRHAGVQTGRSVPRVVRRLEAARQPVPVDGLLPRAHSTEIEGFGRTKGSIHFTAARPLPPAVLDELIRARVIDLEAGDGWMTTPTPQGRGPRPTRRGAALARRATSGKTPSMRSRPPMPSSRSGALTSKRCPRRPSSPRISTSGSERYERAFTSHLAAGDPIRAAAIALGLAVDLAFQGRTSIASGWTRRAARLLEGTPTNLCPRLPRPRAERRGTGAGSPGRGAGAGRGRGADRAELDRSDSPGDRAARARRPQDRGRGDRPMVLRSWRKPRPRPSTTS